MSFSVPPGMYGLSIATNNRRRRVKNIDRSVLNNSKHLDAKVKRFLSNLRQGHERAVCVLEEKNWPNVELIYGSHHVEPTSTPIILRVAPKGYPTILVVGEKMVKRFSELCQRIAQGVRVIPEFNKALQREDTVLSSPATKAHVRRVNAHERRKTSGVYSKRELDLIEPQLSFSQLLLDSQLGDRPDEVKMDYIASLGQKLLRRDLKISKLGEIVLDVADPNSAFKVIRTIPPVFHK